MAGFTFGAIKVTEKLKGNLEKFDCLLAEHYRQDKPYYLLLVDEILNKVHLNLLIKDIERAKIESYNIVSTVTVKNDAIKDSTENLLSVESQWRKYVNFNETKCNCIIAFGSSIRVLNKSADVTYYDFMDDKFNHPRYWCGSEFVNGPDCWIYPAANVRDLYPIHISNDPTNMHTRFFRKQLERIQTDDLSTKDLDMRDYEIRYIETKEETSSVLQTLFNSELLAIDTETSGFSFKKDKLGTIQLSNDGQISYVFDWENVDKRILKKVITTAKRTTLVNSKFDVRFIWENGVTGWYPTDDAMLLAHALNSNRPKGLKSGAIFYCGKFTGYDDELDKAKKRLKVDNYLQIPKEILVNYAGIDSIVTYRLQLALDKEVKRIDKKFPNEKLKNWTIERFYKEIMMPNLHAVTDIEFRGVYIDMEQFAKSEQQIADKIKELKKELAKTWNVTEDFEFESAVKLGQLFKKMGWPEIETSKAGDYKTSDDVLKEYELRNLPGIKTLRDIRSYNVAMNTFINGYREFFVEHLDGTTRMHPNCNTFGTESFRHAMNNPNLQQIPSHGEIAPYIKKLFSTPNNDKENWLIANLDFASLQARNALADEGYDPQGVDQISYDIYGKTGHQDMHSATATETLCKPIHMQIIEIEDENGKKSIFGEEQKIKIIRRGLIDDNKEMIILGKEFIETDEFVGLM